LNKYFYELNVGLDLEKTNKQLELGMKSELDPVRKQTNDSSDELNAQIKQLQLDCQQIASERDQLAVQLEQNKKALNETMASFDEYKEQSNASNKKMESECQLLRNENSGQQLKLAASLKSTEAAEQQIKYIEESHSRSLRTLNDLTEKSNEEKERLRNGRFFMQAFY
jgi:chromosome segregation ATPase